jgi:hypothetical protein
MVPGMRVPGVTDHMRGSVVSQRPSRERVWCGHPSGRDRGIDWPDGELRVGDRRGRSEALRVDPGDGTGPRPTVRLTRSGRRTSSREHHPQGTASPRFVRLTPT